MTNWTRRHLSLPALGLAAIVGLAGAAGAPPARAGEAGTLVTSLDQSLLDTMQHAGQLGYDGRYAKLEPVVQRNFDIPYMTRIAVGPGWTGLSEAQQKQLSDAFGRFITATYARRFNGYSGEKFETVAERPIGQATLVQTRLVKSNGEPVALNYVARQNDGHWQIIDIYLTGTISELAQRRSEFTAVFQRAGYDGLLAALQQKTANEAHLS